MKLWTLLSLHNFEFQNQYFIMILDTATKFFVVRPVHSLNTDATIQVLISIFSEHGMPVSITCDRGYNFVSDLFQQYCSHLGIKLSYSSAYHHSANPVERTIRTVKGLMKKCTKVKQSWRLALLEYLATPLDSKTPSPSELNGRKFGSMLPNVSNFSPKHLTNLWKDTMDSCSKIPMVITWKSCLLAALLAIVIILIIKFIFVLFQKGKPCHMQLVQRMVE